MVLKKLGSSLVVIAAVIGLSGCANPGAANKISVTTNDYKFAPTSWQVN